MQDHSAIKNLYREIYQNNYFRNQHEIKKIYTSPEKIKIPFKNDKIKIDFVQANSSSSLYFYNQNEIYLTGKITENIPILKSEF